jgi:hypothetical protein
MTAMARSRLYVHIGLQKTGTSYLQSIFWLNQDELRRQGLDMVPGSKRETFNLMLRVRDRFRPEFDPPAVASALDKFPAALAAATGSRALLSEESLAPATDAQIRALLDACSEREVHLVVTLRDLGRQIPSAWQQLLQSGGSIGYDDYLRRLRKGEGKPDGAYWNNKDVPAILAAWSAHVPAERIHVVTVPPSGSAPELLLRRFCSVLGVDADHLDKQVARSNESIGRVQAEVLRRVNSLLPQEFRRRDVYGDIGKRFFAVKVLGIQGGRKTVVPQEYEEWVRAVSQKYVDAIVVGGYDVVGDLEDLRPLPSAFSADEVAPDEAEVSEVATQALATMLGKEMTKLRKRRARNRDVSRPRALARRLAHRLRRVNDSENEVVG